MVHTFLLRNSKNPLIQEFENNVSTRLYNELKDFVIEATGGRKSS